MKRGLLIRNVQSHDVPLDSLDNSCVQAFTTNGFLAEVAVLNESEIIQHLMQTHVRSFPVSMRRFNDTGHGQDQDQDQDHAVAFQTHLNHSGSTNPSHNSNATAKNAKNANAIPCDAVIFRASGVPVQRLYPVIRHLRTISKQIFICVFSSQLIEYPMGRYQCFQEGASMVTNSMEDVHRVMRFIAHCGTRRSTANANVNANANANGGGLDGSCKTTNQPNSCQRLALVHDAFTPAMMRIPLRITGKTNYTCPFCGRTGFCEDELWQHCPLYHINEKNPLDTTCPICKSVSHQAFQVHLHNAHGPPGRGEMPSEFQTGDCNLYSFALVVCHNRKYNSFLLVQEFANSGFWLPGGRIDPGENPLRAAMRETAEEAGIEIRLTGVIRIEYHPKTDRQGNSYVRMRFIFAAEPVDCEQLPKSIPDYESVGATWCPLDQVESLPLRGPEPTIYFKHLAQGRPVYPLDMLAC